VTDYKVDLEVYNGPLDLLLYLIKREELDIYDIPIAGITEQYIAYVHMLKEIDPEAVGEFLVMAATLMEIKSRVLLPRPPVAVDDEEDLSDPRSTLVRQLLEYKKFKDAARSLEHSAEERSLRHPRQPAMPETNPEEIELESLDIWSLFEAFNRMLQQIGKAGGFHQVGVDDTPITLHAADITDALQRCGGRQKFEDLFAGRSKPEMIGLFLALLEMIRQRRVRAVQERATSAILVELLDPAPLDAIDEQPIDEDPADSESPFRHHSLQQKESHFTELPGRPDNAEAPGADAPADDFSWVDSVLERTDKDSPES
jgi:segregation and condensation protein A